MISWDYVIAWSLYILSGCGICYVWWKITHWIKQPVLSKLLRGTLVVLIFTPWYASTSTTHLAPAFLVLLFDLVFVETTDQYASGYMLLASFCLMLAVLGASQIRKQ